MLAGDGAAAAAAKPCSCMSVARSRSKRASFIVRLCTLESVATNYGAGGEAVRQEIGVLTIMNAVRRWVARARAWNRNGEPNRSSWNKTETLKTV